MLENSNDNFARSTISPRDVDLLFRDSRDSIKRSREQGTLNEFTGRGYVSRRGAGEEEGREGLVDFERKIIF